MPQDGAPPSIDVLAAQVRRPLDYPIGVTVGKLADAKAALDALVALVKEWQDATERAIANGAGNVDRLHERINELKAERDALVARVTEVERREHGLNDDWLAASERAAKAEAALADARNALERIAEGFDAYYASANRLEGLGEILNREQFAREVLARLDGEQR